MSLIQLKISQDMMEVNIMQKHTHIEFMVFMCRIIWIILKREKMLRRNLRSNSNNGRSRWILKIWDRFKIFIKRCMLRLERILKERKRRGRQNQSEKRRKLELELLLLQIQKEENGRESLEESQRIEKKL